MCCVFLYQVLQPFFCVYSTFSIICYCQVPSRPSRSRQCSRMNACPQDERDRSTHFMPEVPQIHTTRLTDLLSGPLSSIHGPQRLAFDQFFQEIDSTLKENTSAIQLCIENIVRAPYHLAGKCRPLLEDLAHAQMNTGHGSVGEQSLVNQGCSQDVNIQAAHGTSSCVHIKYIWLITLQISKSFVLCCRSRPTTKPSSVPSSLVPTASFKGR
jgi:hypothetical protein